MKEALIALLTVTINRYSRHDKGSLIKAETIIKDLTDILDYIEGSKEETQSGETIYRAGQYESLCKQIEQLKECLHDGDAEIITLRERIRKVNENYRIFAEVEHKLHKRIELLSNILTAVLPFLPKGYRRNIKTVLEGKE